MPSPPPKFNHALMAFLPKGDDGDEHALIAREAAATRPISMRNCDAKIVARALAGPLAEAASVGVS
eukprot:12895728-Alexandrium_andersonii.AAC.1